jgi:hypothetical protein
MTLQKKSTATQELGALSDVIISAAGPHRRSRGPVLMLCARNQSGWRRAGNDAS